MYYGSIGALLAIFAAAASPPPDCVVLLHGLARTERSMRPLADRLTYAGYQVLNIGYPSRTARFDDLVRHVRREIEPCASDFPSRVHFVTHSLGGIVLRAYLHDHRPENLGRVVMLAPPNHGSELADVLAGFPPFDALYGPVAAELGTDPASWPNRLGPADFELGIIAGNKSINPAGSWLIPGPDDGTVSVASARLEGMTDFLVLPVTHFFMMADKAVAAETLHFLRHGRFSHAPHQQISPGFQPYPARQPPAAEQAR
jgi:pimeloyl-ACP methyl ester carboxylesterase